MTKQTPWQTLDKLAKEKFGEFGFTSIPEAEMAKFIDIKKADKFAEDEFGEFGFASLKEAEMRALINAHPELLKTKTSESMPVLKSLLQIINEETGDKNFDSKMKSIISGKSVLPDDEVRDNVKGKDAPPPRPLTGELARFDKWYSKHNLWHPGFPSRFADCAAEYLSVDEEVLVRVGELIADHAHSFYGERMGDFIDYAKTHKIPDPEEFEDGVDDDDHDDPTTYYDAVSKEFDAALEKYVKTALRNM